MPSGQTAYLIPKSPIFGRILEGSGEKEFGIIFANWYIS
jgi:hypothetical protein